MFIASAVLFINSANKILIVGGALFINGAS